MSAESDALDAVNTFVEAVSETNSSSKDLLENQSDPISQTAVAVGTQMGQLALAADPLFSGITDPFQLQLLEANMAQFGESLISDSIVTNTGNTLNRIFAQAQAAVFSLFQMTPDFFYSTASNSSDALKKLIATAIADAAIVAAEAPLYEAFQLGMDRTDLNNLTAAAMANLKSKTIGALTQVNVALNQSKNQGAITPPTIAACITAITGMCVTFTNPAAIIAVLFMNDLLAKLDTLDRDVDAVLLAQGQFATSFTNTLTANVASPIQKTVQTISDQISSVLEQLTAQIGLGFDKFASLLQAVALCQQAHVLIQGLLKTPAAVMGDITASVHFPVVKPITVGIGSLGDGPAKAYLVSSAAFRQVIQSVMVAPILPQLTAKTADLLAKIAALEGWLAAQEALLVAMPAVTNALASLAGDVLGVSALDNVQGFVASGDIKSFANSSANTASTAGAAADAIAQVIDTLPISEASKAGALADVMANLLAIEASQVIATQAMIEENPGSIGAVDTLAEQTLQIQQQAEALLTR